MDWVIATSYLGYFVAVALCWGLGPLFRIPMLINLAFNICLSLGFLSGWDIRAIIAAHGFAFFLWVLALTQSINRSTLVFLLLLDVGVAFHSMWPDIQSTGIGQDFWSSVSTHIIEVWMASIFGLAGITIFKSSALLALQKRRIDVLTNPKKRFLIPICAWAGMIVIPLWVSSYVPDFLVRNRFAIAGELLVWGWVGLELPFYLMHRRLMRSMQG